jgi:hypothetical protein
MLHGAVDVLKVLQIAGKSRRIPEVDFPGIGGHFGWV